ncbi:hypothetical protein V5O48_007871 [Marasmius crinis-equi]|uniref:DUF6534 domain-containing protein n=1 Tax=Marasmius crinis-equi TaxID=585013 RepID=A0ABR3FFG4_9AGAR
MLVERAEQVPNIGAVAGPHATSSTGASSEFSVFKSVSPFALVSLTAGDITETYTGILVLYYLAFPRDKRSMKALVYGLLILDTVQTVLITNDAFIKYGLEFSKVSGLSAMRNAWFSIPTISAINGTAVQLFFAWRISKLSESNILGGVVALLSIAGGAGGLAAGIQSRIINNLAVVAVQARTSLTIWLTISGACDVIIAICMVVILSKKRSGFNTATDDAITRIIRLTVETGSLTAILAIITVALFFSFPTRAYWNVPIDVLGKLYSNNLMVILNRRIKISDGRTSTTAPQTSSSHHNINPARNGTTSVQVDMPIKIHREVWSRADTDSDTNGIKMETMGSPAGMHPYSIPPDMRV